MKKKISLLLSLIIFVCGFSTISLASETNSTNIAVDWTVENKELHLDISAIPVKSKKQMLSISLIDKDTNEENVTTSDVAYTQTLYLNGKNNIRHDIDTDNINIMDCRLVIRDSHDSVKYSQLLGIKVKEYSIAQYNTFRSESGNTDPKENGYVFAGWFSDEECKTVLSSATTEKVAYAKFVDADVLSVKAQITAGTKADSEKTNIRFVSTVDTLDYKKVGFDITIQGRDKQTIETTTVYEKLFKVGSNDVVDEVVLTDEFSPFTLYAYAYSYWNVPNGYFDTEFTVTPYWVTLDGTTVYGETEVKKVSMGITNGGAY